MLRLTHPLALVRSARALEDPSAGDENTKARLSWITPLLVFLFAAGLTFSAVYIDTLRSATGLNVPRFVRAILPDPSLGLRVEYQGEHLLVGWSRQSPTVRQAVAGVLRIEDGGEQRSVHLDATQIAAGSLLYKPASDDITFRLELYGDQGNTTVESMRVLVPRDAVPANSPGAAKPEDPAPAQSRNTSDSSAAKDPAEVKRRLRLAPDAGASKPESRDADPPAPSEPQPRTPQSNPPAGSPPSASLTGTMPMTQGTPLPDGKTLSLFKPARALRQVMPDDSVLRSAAIDRPMRVAVRVTVDTTGHVKEARLIRSQAMAPGLPAAVLAAARQWLFEPATWQGRPVESEHSIVFSFQPSSQ